MAMKRNLEQLGGDQPLDLTCDVGLEQETSADEPGRQPLAAGAARCPPGKLDRQRRSGKEQIRRRAQEIPADCPAVQRKRPDECEMAVDKCVDALAAAGDVAMRGVAHDSGGEFLLRGVEHLQLEIEGMLPTVKQSFLLLNSAMPAFAGHKHL